RAPGRHARSRRHARRDLHYAGRPRRSDRAGARRGVRRARPRHAGPDVRAQRTRAGPRTGPCRVDRAPRARHSGQHVLDRRLGGAEPRALGDAPGVVAAVGVLIAGAVSLVSGISLLVGSFLSVVSFAGTMGLSLTGLVAVLAKIIGVASLVVAGIAALV